MSASAIQEFKEAFKRGAAGVDTGRSRDWHEFGEGAGEDERERARGDRQSAFDEYHAACAELEKRLREYERLIEVMQKTGFDPEVIKEAEQRLVDDRAFIADTPTDQDALPRKAKQTVSLTGALETHMDEVRKAAKTKPISAQGFDGTSQTVFWADLGGYELYEKRSRDMAVSGMAAKIGDGKALLEKLDEDPAPSMKDATALLWALKTEAQSKSGGFTEGSMTVPDNPALRRYLDRCRDTVFAPSPGGGLDLWGVDMHDSHESNLPTGLGGLEYRTVRGPDGQDQLVLEFKASAADLLPPEPTMAAESATDTLNRAALSLYRTAKKGEAGGAGKALQGEAEALLAAAPKALQPTLKLTLGTGLELPSFLNALVTLSGEPIDDQEFIRAAMGFLKRVRSALSARP